MKRDRLAILCFAAMAITLLMMVLGGGKMQGPDVDDGWFFWKAWNLRMLGGLDDQLFGGWGLKLFGRIWVELLATAYQLTGWNLIAGRILSSLSIAGAAAVWYVLGERLGWTRPQRLALALLLIVLLPYLKAGLIARPEAFVWLLSSLGVLALDRGRYFLAGCAAALAIESHQMGFVSLGYLAAWRWRMHWSAPAAAPLLPPWPQALRFGAALALGAIIYLSLHLAPILAATAKATFLSLGRKVSWETPFVAYFQSDSLLRRLWVGALLLGASGYYTATRGWQREPFALMVFVCILTVFLCVPRANPLYLVYIFLPVALIVASTVMKRWGWVAVAGIVAVSWTGYAGSIFLNRDYSQSVLTTRLRAELGDTSIPAVIEPRYFPMLYWRTNFIGLHNLQLVTRGKAFSVTTPLKLRDETRAQLPAGAREIEINLGPRATSFVFHVPAQP